MIRNSLIFLLTVLSIMSYGQAGVSHKSFDELLQSYVNQEGLVDYKGLLKEKSKLNYYLSVLQENPPQKSWSEEEKLAFWINAYNAFTLELILQHYPVESIKDIGSTIKIPFVSTAWDIEFIRIGEETYTLNNIEHRIIRKDFNEPRIHFALVCAAVSCPKLLNRAYTPEKLDAQLTDASQEFLSNPKKNEILNSQSIRLSKLFNWYGGDFNINGTLIDFINQYSPIQLNEKSKIDWMEYDWSLNEQK